MGQLLQSNVNASTIFKGHQPIGLYSHRGHSSFVLAAVAVITLVGWQRSWINTRLAATAGILIIPALLFTQTRAGLGALIVGIAYLIGRKHYKLLIPAALASILVITITTTTRQLNNLPIIKQITSDRVHLWEISSRGVQHRPLLGWGMNGFGTAYPHIRSSKFIPKVTRLDDFTFDYLDQEGEVKTNTLITVKAHNLILDTILSVGILGLVAYLALLGFCIWQVINSPYRGIEAVVVAYLVFTFTWFECAQFTHIVWWALSFYGVSNVRDKVTS
ncbi:MAG: O-antigen ligase family protein [Scytonematopsis contorta HA4267-MV1]|jgi:O-antigen ligase|nr:O-antigen ligase family protein [Scytonematopsis contorta HA4267-MV1]